jgi:1-deoxy-D-xylulose-5-phosphate synthase
VFIREWGTSLCLAFTGSLYPEVWDAAERLLTLDIAVDLYNLRFLKPIHEDYLASILNRYEIVICIEEGILEGGIGEYAAELAMRRHCSAQVYTLGVSEPFISQGKREELLHLNGLDGEGIAASVLQCYEENRIVRYSRTLQPVHRGFR